MTRKSRQFEQPGRGSMEETENKPSTENGIQKTRIVEYENGSEEREEDRRSEITVKTG